MGNFKWKKITMLELEDGDYLNDLRCVVKTRSFQESCRKVKIQCDYYLTLGILGLGWRRVVLIHVKQAIWLSML